MKTSFFALLAMLCMMSCTPTFNGTLYRIQENGLYGFIDSVGNVIIEPQYKYASPFSDDLAFVVHNIEEKGSRVEYYYINKQNELVMDTMEVKIIKSNVFLLIGEDGYTEDDELDSWYRKFEDGSFNFCDRTFDGLSLNDGLIVFQDENTKRWGYKDAHGQIKIPPIYAKAGRFNEERVVTMDTNLVVHVIDIAGNSKFNWSIFDKGLIAFPYLYRNGFVLAYDADKNYNFINKEGMVVCSGPTGILCYPFSDNGYALVNIAGYAYSYINTNGDFLTDLDKDGELSLGREVFPNVTEYSEGYASCEVSDGWVFMDENFKFVSEVYDSTGYFSEGYAKVQLGARWGYVNKDFNQVIPFRYYECGDFHHGLAYFYNSGVEGYINKSGEVVWSTIRKRE